MRRLTRWRERGVAVVTAMLLTTLAITIVASLFWQQQVQVRSIENQRLQLQKQWILRGALDWARLILREDRLFSGNVDTLDEPWSVPLMDTRLDQYVEEGQADTTAADAVLSGVVIDAQSRFNLNNMSRSGKIDPQQVAIYERLLALMQLNPALARETANAVAASQRAALAPGSEGASQMGGNQPRPIKMIYVHDLLAVPGYTPEAIEKLREFVVFLPQVTTVNINTASAEVLAASVEGLSLADAKGLVNSRSAAYFRNEGDINLRITNGDTKQLGVQTSYFIINGRVRMNRAGLEVEALVHREGKGKTRLEWLQQR